MLFRTLQRMTQSQSRIALACATAATLGPLVPKATAIPLLYDVRVHGTGGKDVVVNGPGDVVVLDLFAVVTGNDSDLSNDGFKSGIGSFRSTNGGLLGDLFGLPPIAPFNDVYSTGGQQFDLDGDGDLDVGSNNHATATGFYAVLHRFVAVFDQPPGGFLIGQVRFTASLLGAESTTVNWVQRQASTANAYAVDGNYIVSGPSASTGVGAPVTIHAAQVSDPGPPTFLGGQIDTHVTVTGVIRPTAGQTLILNRGVTVTANSLLDTRSAAGNYGAHELRVNDDSANLGGAAFINTMQVGATAPGTFTQSAGLTQLGSTLTVGAGDAGRLIVTGGSMTVPTINVAAGGNVSASGGYLTAGTLNVAPGGELVVTANGEVSALNATITGSGSGASGAAFAQSGGAVAFNGTVNFNPGGSAATSTLARVSGGNFAALRTGIWGNTIVEHTGGTFASGILNIGHTPSASSSPATYFLSGGTLACTSATLGDPDDGLEGRASVIQTGGHLRSLGGTIHVYDSYELHGGDARLFGLVINAPTGMLAGLLDQSGGELTTDYLDVKGTYRITGGTFTVNKQLRVFPGGTIDFANSLGAVAAGTNSLLDLPSTGLVNTSGATLVGEPGSLIQYSAGHDPRDSFGSVQTEGLLHEHGTPLLVPAGKSIHGVGSITGNVTVEGRVGPGYEGGTLDIIGSYAQLDDSALDIEIGGSAADAFDRIAISGGANLDGDLTVTLLGNFVPLATHTFTILTAGARVGTFDNALSQVYFSGGRFDVTYTNTSVILSNFSAVPEPGVAALAVAAAGATLARRGRRG